MLLISKGLGQNKLCSPHSLFSTPTFFNWSVQYLDNTITVSIPIVGANIKRLFQGKWKHEVDWNWQKLIIFFILIHFFFLASTCKLYCLDKSNLFDLMFSRFFSIKLGIQILEHEVGFWCYPFEGERGHWTSKLTLYVNHQIALFVSGYIHASSLH